MVQKAWDKQLQREPAVACAEKRPRMAMQSSPAEPNESSAFWPSPGFKRGCQCSAAFRGPPIWPDAVACLTLYDSILFVVCLMLKVIRIAPWP